MAALILIRGIPGSGKSTLAKSILRPGWEHLENDMYCYNDKGEYDWDWGTKNCAPEKCLGDAAVCIRNGKSVIVANTFCTLRSMMPYIELAMKHGAKLQIITATGHFENQHGVSQGTLQSMRSSFENIKDFTYNMEA